MPTSHSPVPAAGPSSSFGPAVPTDGPSGRRWVRLLLLVVVVALAAMWIYALFFASKKAAYKVDDPAWRAHAEEVCTRYEEERLALTDTEGGYIAEPTEEQMIERADVVDAATDLLQRMIDEVTGFAPQSARDQELVAKYAGFYATMLADRRAYTARLRAFELEPYRETKIEGGPVTNILVDFATVNELPHCSPPQELGGDT